MEANAFKAVIKSAPSKEMSKSNSGAYVLINCEIQEGPAKGHIVAGTRTIVNGKGEKKDIPEIGDEITLYHQYLESSVEEGKYVHFFEISTGLPQTSNEELSMLFGLVPSTEKAQSL